MAKLPKYYKVHVDRATMDVTLEPIYEEIVPVVRGVWLYKDFHGEKCYAVEGAWSCSHCGFTVPAKSRYHYDIDAMRYCPYCGAKMDGDKE